MNEKILTVSALTQYIKKKFVLDPYLHQVTLIGEISNFKLRNRHQYFSLKDEQAVINATMWEATFKKLPFKLEEGMKVIATGRISIYEPAGTYQIIIEQLQPDGVGALYQALQQMIVTYKKEGIFDYLQRPIERFPKKIAVITSPSGAVIRDIMTTLNRRYPIVEVVLFPTRVQGQEAVAEIISAIEQVNLRFDEFDTLIIARGGGSIEDLWCFNDEKVAKAILSTHIPVIAAIGHETDTTITELVADLRAPTPTAAAELAVPVLLELVQQIKTMQDRLIHGIRMQLKQKHQSLQNSQQSYILSQPQQLYQTYVQKFDYLYQNLIRTSKNVLQVKQHHWHLLNQNLMTSSPTQLYESKQQAFNYLSEGLVKAISQQVTLHSQIFQKQVLQLEAYNPLKIIARGYAVLSDDDGIIYSTEQVELDHTVKIRLKDGQLRARITKIERENLNG